MLVEKLVTVHGMEQCMTDPCVFRLIREGKVVLILTVHVDEMAVAGTGVEVHKLLVTLNTDFTPRRAILLHGVFHHPGH